jgi:hypothetical protein
VCATSTTAAGAAGAAAGAAAGRAAGRAAAAASTTTHRAAAGAPASKTAAAAAAAAAAAVQKVACPAWHLQGLWGGWACRLLALWVTFDSGARGCMQPCRCRFVLSFAHSGVMWGLVQGAVSDSSSAVFPAHVCIA